MNKLQELRIHVDALNTATSQDQKFFASILHYMHRLRDLLNGPPAEMSRPELEVSTRAIETFFQKYRPSGREDGFYIPPHQTSHSDPTVQEIARIVGELVGMSDSDFQLCVDGALADRAVVHEETGSIAQPRCVFIGHGHSKLWARVKVFLDEVGVPSMSFESESRTGEAITAVLEQMLSQASFAILVLTAEDETAQGSRRARQNVVHEAGLFQGRIGFKRAVLLVQAGLEEFTNVAGLQHIPFADDNVEQSIYELQRTMRREGIIK